MNPRRTSRHPVSPADARAYLSKSKAWLDAAVENSTPADGTWLLAAQ